MLSYSSLLLKTIFLLQHWNEEALKLNLIHSRSFYVPGPFLGRLHKKVGDARLAAIGGENRGARPPLNLRSLHRNVIFAIENHFSLVKWPPLLSVASSASASS